MGAEDSLTHPTYIIGVGQAGINVMNTLHEVAQENDDGHKFQFAAIDTDVDALSSTPREALNFQLEIEDDFIDEDRANYPYLTGRMNLEDKGARRQRPVGRYKLDNKNEFESTFEQIWSEIESHYEDHSADLGPQQASFDIFLIHSLGGGTGSGTFPLLLMMLDMIAEDLDSDYVYTAGMGVVPEIPMNEDGQGPIPLPGSPIYYPNAHAALHDLEKFELLEIINNTSYDRHMPSDVVEENRTLELPVHSSRLQGAGPRSHVTQFSLDGGPPFDDYWLMGVDEGDIDGRIAGQTGPETYRQEVNQIMARSLYAITQFSSGAENWTQGKSVLGTPDQAEVYVANDEVEAYAELKAEKEAKERRKNEEIPEEIEELEAQIESLKTRKSNLNLDDIDDEELIREIRNYLGKEGFRKGSAIVESKSQSDIEAILDEVADDYDIEGQIIAVDVLDEKLSQQEGGAPEVEEEHKDIVQDIWSTYNLQTLPGNSGIKTTTGKAQEARAYLDDEISEYKEIKEEWDPDLLGQIQDTLPPLIGIFESERENAEAWLAALQSDYDDLERIMGTWGRVTSMQQAISDRRSDIRSQITAKMNELEQEIDSLRDEQDELADQIRSKEREMSSKIETLTTAQTSMRQVDLPLVQSELRDIDLDLVQNHLNSLADYVDEGLIDETKVRRALSQRIDFAASWKNNVIDGDTNKTEIPVYADDTDEFWYLYHPDNRELLDLIDKATDADEQKEPGGELEYLDDPYRIEYVTFTRRGPVSRLKLYQMLNNLADNGRLERLGAQYENYLQAFAYVEWYGREVKNAFDADLRVTVSRPPEMDHTRVDKPELSEGELKNFVKVSGLDSYIWQGMMWDAYEPTDQRFTGWEKKLRREGIGWNQLQTSTPDSDLKAQWLAGQADWEDIVDAYQQNLIEKTGIKVQFEDD
ncbi:tubulin-like doman-containing protein [Haloplanus aerogenes]|uniref:Tubulin-like protein n=1 Tax=Haloplanus aerogenes TaxID=660522 RepID=A0A3M0DPN6_9EURY|nr:tubulin-like doman-containing protein [Haloplanus aerogenes]AZH24656.1 hypothetical protein DU502_04320 [Haloplanus aerogenes]RMB23687.1 tubulin-like protein [Haloplanus aerogenes]